MAHNSNPTPPGDDPTLAVVTPDGRMLVTVAALRQLPAHTLRDAIIASTGHPASGPFDLTGATLRTVIAAYAPGLWSAALVSSGDGFGTHVLAEEWLGETARPILLAHTLDGRPLTRAEGLVRLIVPTETDEALRQVKWVAEILLLR
jgi:DMSO/TMAO reductase YedYZ molybdopterin-dependent catalytic subunit